MARYVLDDARALELLASASVWDDFPANPGEVFEYEGRCERFVLLPSEQGRFEVDTRMQVGEGRE